MAPAEAAPGELDPVPQPGLDDSRYPGRGSVPQMAGIDRVREDAPGGVEGEPDPVGDLRIGQALSRGDETGPDPLEVGRDRIEDRWLARSRVAVRRLTTGLAQPAALGRQALADPTAELATV